MGIMAAAVGTVTAPNTMVTAAVETTGVRSLHTVSVKMAGKSEVSPLSLPSQNSFLAFPCNNLDEIEFYSRSVLLRNQCVREA
jgi:hypothetical protein